jgi:hypothetical protein
MAVELDGAHGTRERIEQRRPRQIQSECARDVEGRRPRRASRAEEEGAEMGTPQRAQSAPIGISIVRQHAGQSALGCPRSSHESHAAQRRGSNRVRVNAAQPPIRRAALERRAFRCNGCEEDESMRSFVFGVMVGAIAMYLNLQGFGPIVHYCRGLVADGLGAAAKRFTTVVLPLTVVRMALSEAQLTADLTAAMKARDMPRVYVLRGLLTAAKNLKVERRAQSLSEGRSRAARRREVRQREEAEGVRQEGGP